MEIIMTFNFLAIITAAIASFVCGGILVAISGKVFPKLNANTGGKNKPNPRVLVCIFVANLAMALGVAYLVYLSDIRTIFDTLTFLIFLVVGFVGPLTLGTVWLGKTVRWWIVQNLINAVCLWVIVLIVALWR